MRVLARVDARGRCLRATHTARRLGPRGYAPLPLSAQSMYSAEDIEAMLQPHVRPDGNVDTVFIEFESEQIPLCHQGELRLAARLAALYHNALVETNLGPPEPAAEEDPADCVLSPAEDGAPAYGDEDFELNEELLPWNMKGIREEERWGL